MRRALTICSYAQAIEDEINHLTNVFCNVNQYPRKVVESVIIEEKEKHTKEEIIEDKNGDQNKSEKTVIVLSLPYGGEKGEKLIKRFTKGCNKKLNENTKIQVPYKSSKLSERFQVKERTKLEHRHNVM